MFSPSARFTARSLVHLVAILLSTLLLAGAADAATVRGSVSDPDGRAAPGAGVLLSNSLATDAATTDARGWFEFAGLPGGHYELRVSLEGFWADPVPLDLGADDMREVTVELRLAAIAETLVVSAAQIDLPLSRATDSLTVVGARDLRAHQIETVADALRAVPGVTLARSGGRGALTSFFPRGGESDFTLVLVDGVRVNSFGGGYDFAHLPVAGVERIEVVRGPQSALYGADAIGAVVHIVSQQGGPHRAEALAEGGSFETARFSAATAGSTGPWSWGAAGEWFGTDGFTGIAPATGERVSNDDYRRRELSATLGWYGGWESHLRSHVRVGSQERGFPGPFGSNPTGVFGGVDVISRGEQATRLASVGGALAWTPRVRQRAHLAYGQLESDFTSPFGVSQSATRRLSGRVQMDVAWSGQVGVSVGIEVQRERASSTFITGATFNPIPVRRRVTGSFGEVRLERGERVFLTAGLRVEQIRRDQLEPDPFELRPLLAADSVTSVNPKLSLTWFLQPPDARSRRWTRLRASTGTGIRAPDAFEIAFTDNPGLKPERSRSADVGIEQAFGGGAVVAEAVAFLNHYDDLIVAVGRSLRDASQFQTDNISNARARGLELSTAARWAWGLHARVTYTWLVTEILGVDRIATAAPPPFTVGDPLIRRPRHHGAVDALLVRGPLSAFARLGARGRMLDVEPSLGALGGLFRAPGYAVVDVGATVRLRKGVELFGRLSNLLDRRYEETLGFPALGRHGMAGIRVAAGH